MILASFTILALLTLTTTSAYPHLRPRDPVAQLISIAPTSGTCTNAPFPLECATASTAIAPLIASFANYSITTAAEQAALLSWMAFESGDFKYNQNHFPAPGNPGQGTRCMMSPAFVQEYVDSIPEVSAQAVGSEPAQVLALVQGDEYSFASAAWFLSTQCDAGVRQGLQTGTLEGWMGWVSGCVGTTVTEERQAYWERAVVALGI